MSEFRVAIFDFDGTLFDTRTAIIHCIQLTFAEAGRALPAIEAIGETVKSGIRLRDTLAALDAGLNGDSSQIDNLIGIYRKIYAAQAAQLQKPYPGAQEALKELLADGTKSVVVSNKGIVAIRGVLDGSKLSAYIDLVFGDELDLPKKPDPTILVEHILPRYAGVSKSEILVIGDTETDILFAHAAGLSSCWASYGYGEPERCLKLAPDYMITAIEQLPGLIRAAAVKTG